MNLDSKTKKYIKKNVRVLPLETLAKSQNITKEEVVSYLYKIWDKKKVKKILSNQQNSTKYNELEMPKNKLIKKLIPFFVLSLILIVIIYLNTLNAEFVSDDISAIKENNLINSSSSFLHGFRPNIREFMLFVTHKLVGTDPTLYRLENIFFHIANSWLTMIIISSFFGLYVGVISGLLFAVHPLQIEAVTWISGGAYSFGTFFCLASLFLYINSKRIKSKNYLFSLLSYTIGLLSWAQAIIFGPIIFLYEFANRSLKINAKKIIPFFVVNLVFVFLYVISFQERVASLSTNFSQESQLQNPLLVIPTAVASYLKLIFWPSDLTLYHSELILSHTRIAINSIVFLTFCALTLYFLKKHRQIFFFLAFFIIAISPSLTPFIVSWVVAERYVYMANIGIFVALSFFVVKFIKRKEILSIIVAVVISLLSVRSIIRNKDWQNQDTLWLSAAKTSPSSPQNHNNLGDYYARQKNLDQAIAEFKRATELKPNYSDAYHNLANTYQQKGDLQNAEINYLKALEFNPNIWQSHYNLGLIYINTGRKELGKAELIKALELSKDNRIQEIIDKVDLMEQAPQ